MKRRTPLKLSFDYVDTAERRVLSLEKDGLFCLPVIGFDLIAPPDGAFYVYADVSDLTDDSRAFAAEILERAGVAVTPGLDFDPVRGTRTLRFFWKTARKSAGRTANMRP